MADTILRFAKEYRVGHVVIGRPTPKPFWKRLGKNRDVVGDILINAREVTVIVLDTREEPVKSVTIPEKATPGPEKPSVQPMSRIRLSSLLSPRGIVIWDQSVPKDVVLRTLVEAIGKDAATDPATLLKEIMKREEHGSTFFNEGVAFPHVRIDTLITPMVALGLTRQGVSGVSTEKPIEFVFLILSPSQNPDTQVQVLGLASRAAQDRHLFHALRSGQTPEEVMRAIHDSEAANESKRAELS